MSNLRLPLPHTAGVLVAIAILGWAYLSLPASIDKMTSIPANSAQVGLILTIISGTLTSIMLTLGVLASAFVSVAGALLGLVFWLASPILVVASRLNAAVLAISGGLVGLSAWVSPADQTAALREAWRQCLTNTFRAQNALMPDEKVKAADVALETCRPEEDTLFRAASESNPAVGKARNDLRTREKARILRQEGKVSVSN